MLKNLYRNAENVYLCHRKLIKAPRAYSGSALRLFQKRLVLISEAPRAYFGSASRLFQKRRQDRSPQRGYFKAKEWNFLNIGKEMKEPFKLK